MGFGLGSIGSAVGGALGGGSLMGLGTALSAGSSIAGYLGQKKANEMNRDLAHDQMRFQREMSNTAYQRAIEDMRKAGLNPILAGKLGGASTPGGSMPVMHSELGAGIQGMSTGMSTAREASDVRLKNATAVLQENFSSSSEAMEKLGAGFRDLVTDADGKIRSDFDKAGEAFRDWVRVFSLKAKQAGVNAYEFAKEMIKGIDDLSVDEIKNLMPDVMFRRD